MGFVPAQISVSAAESRIQRHSEAQLDQQEADKDLAEAMADGVEEREDESRVEVRGAALNSRQISRIDATRRREARRQRAEARRRRAAARAERQRNRDSAAAADASKPPPARPELKGADRQQGGEIVGVVLDARKKEKERQRRKAEESRKKMETVIKLGLDKSDESALTAANETIKTDNAILPGTFTPPVFYPPKIKQGLFAFRDLENSITSRGRLPLDTDLDIDRALRDASISPRRPEIIAKIPLFQMTNGRGTRNLHELRQFEKSLRLEGLDSDWTKINLNAKKEILNEISDFHASSVEKDEKYLQFLSDLRNYMNFSIDLLDIKKNSNQLTNSAKSFAQQLIEPREQDFSNYPESIEGFIAEICGFTASSPNYFSNTKIIHTIIREFANSIQRHYPTLLSVAIDKREDQKSLAYDQYSPEGADSHSMSVRALGNRNIQRVITNNEVDRGYRLSVTESVYNVLPGISSVRISQDRIKVISALLHNELIVSSGIGRLLGTNLGNLIGVTGVDPVEKILGGFFKNSSSVLAGTGASLSYADLLVINENVQNSGVVVLPFERSVVQSTTGKEYLPGSAFFIESPIKQGSIVSPLASFSKRLSDLDLNSQNAFKVLLDLGEECKFSPDNIVVRCLKSIRDIAAILSSNSPTNPVPVAISLPVAYLSLSKGKSYKDRDYRISDDFKFRQTPIDTLFTVCALRRNNTDEINSKNSDQSVLDFIPKKSYARLVSPSVVSIFEESNKPITENTQIDAAAATFLKIYESLFDKLLLDNISWDESNSGPKNKIFGDSTARSPSENLEYYEASFFTDSKSIFDEIVNVLRSIQADVYAIKQRAGSDLGYLDNDGLSRYNRWDDNTMLACVFELMRCLVTELLPMQKIFASPGVSQQLDTPKNYNVKWDNDSMLRLRNFLDILISTHEAGAPLNEIFDQEGNSNSVPGVSSSTTFRPEGLRAGQIIDLINSLVEQRKFFKICLGYLNSIANNVNESNKKLAEFFQNSDGSENFAERFNTITSSKAGNAAIEMLSESQNSLKRFYGMNREPLPRPCGLKINSINNQEEDDIQEFFLDTMSLLTSTDDTALCVGIPAGLIESLQNPKVTEELTSNTGAQRISRANNRHIALEINKVSELFADIQYSPVELVYDPQLWIMPGALSFKRDELTGNVIKTVSSIIDGTTYTRIVNGKIVDSKSGAEILIEAESKDAMRNILRNHVVDRIYKNFSRDVMGVNLDETAWFADNRLGSNIIDSNTFVSLQKILLDPVAANTVQLNGDQLALMFEPADERNFPGIRRLRAPSILLDLMRSNRIPRDGAEKVLKLLGNNLLNSFVENQRLLSPRLFDRVFAVLIKSSGSSGSKLSFCTPIKILSSNIADASAQKIIPLKKSFEISGYMCSVSLR